MAFQNIFPLILKTSHTFFNFGCYISLLHFVGSIFVMYMYMPVLCSISLSYRLSPNYDVKLLTHCMDLAVLLFPFIVELPFDCYEYIFFVFRIIGCVVYSVITLY